jgi:hypothetical protein
MNISIIIDVDIKPAVLNCWIIASVKEILIDHACYQNITL